MIYVLLFFSSLSQKCADALIQEAMMHRFLVFTNQEPLTWQDQIHFTEIMGEGSAFPDATSANRAFHPKFLTTFILIIISSDASDGDFELL